MQPLISPQVNPANKTIEFYAHNSCASHVTLTGSFNNWAKNELVMHPEKDGVWKIEIPMLPKGKYTYKFYVDDKMWMEDVDNPLREPDGVFGFNNILTI
jgi:1,4-alpha-glucan branching enzyme